MSMSGGGMARAVSEMNVTPLIDVLLVLLIIFMVIVPAVPKGLGALIPQTAKSKADPPTLTDTIVVQVQANGEGAPIYRINGTAFARTELEPKLAAIFAVRQEKVMFVQADAGLEFSSVAEVIDLGHGAGVENIGLMTLRMATGE